MGDRAGGVESLFSLFIGSLDTCVHIWSLVSCGLACTLCQSISEYDKTKIENEQNMVLRDPFPFTNISVVGYTHSLRD